MLVTTLKLLLGHAFGEAVENGIAPHVARTSIIGPTLLLLLLIVVIAVAQGLIVRFVVFRKPLSKKKACLLTIILSCLNLLPGAAIYKIIGLPVGGFIASAVLWYTYPILRFGSLNFLNFQFKRGFWDAVEFGFLILVTSHWVVLLASILGGGLVGVTSSIGLVKTGSNNIFSLVVAVGTIFAVLASGLLSILISMKILSRKGFDFGIKEKGLLFFMVSLLLVPEGWFAVLGGWILLLIPTYLTTLTPKNEIPESEVIIGPMFDTFDSQGNERIRDFTKWKP